MDGREEIRTFPLSVEEYFTNHEWAQRTSEIFFDSRREISYLQVAM